MTARKTAHDADITPTRLEAFSDGVIAIIITIMVLELKVPQEETLEALLGQWHLFVSYLLSFILVAEYWLNHHMLFHMVKKVDNRLLWANLVLLFCTSLIPFFTGYMAENHISAFTVSAYSLWSFVCAAAFLLLVTSVFRHVDLSHEEKRCMRRAAVFKVAVAMLLYIAAAVVAFANPYIALLLNFAVAALYFLPTTWIEKRR